LNWTDFHFLEPVWLLALLPLAWLWQALRRRGARRESAWDSVCDAHLRPHVLVDGAQTPTTWPFALLAVSWLLAVVALAGPTWEKIQLPAYRLQHATVILLDLSRSMDATDLQPSRLERAKFKLRDILARSQEGQTALVVFAGEPYVLSPLTDDANTITALTPTLVTALMPIQGSRPDTAITRATELLRNAGARSGEVLLITDGVATPAASLQAAAQARAAGYRVSVLGVGTGHGAPIPAGDGFVKDAGGAVVIAKLDAPVLAQVAQQGGGLYQTMTPDDADIDGLLPRRSLSAEQIAASDTPQQTERWREMGPWLLLAIVPLASLAFRRGWLGMLLLTVVPALLAPAPTHAAGWQDYWQRPDQQGVAALADDNPAQAAALFEDPLWRAAALYRAGRFQEAAALLETLDTPLAQYNRGNALARLGQYTEALAAYDAALRLAPDDEDAQFNRQLMQKLLEKAQSGSEANSSTPQQQSGQQQPGQQQSGQSAASPSSTPSITNNATADAQSPGDASVKPEPGAGRGSAAAQPPDPEPQDQRGARKGPAQNDPASGARSAAPPASGDVAHGASDAPDGADAHAAEQRETTQGEGPSGTEQQQALEQWLRRVPDDPGGLLRRKFLRDHSLQGTVPDPAEQPW
jgi:Ca-activated chloride channel family protein